MLTEWHRGRFFVTGRRLDKSVGKIDVVDLEPTSQIGWLTEMLTIIKNPHDVQAPTPGTGGPQEFRQMEPDVVREKRPTPMHLPGFGRSEPEG